MKKLIYSLVFVIATVSANAGGGGTISSLLEKTINATLRTKSPDVTCDYQSGSQTIRLFRNGVAATCPTKACPTPGLAGTFNYDEYHFKNTSSFPICLTVNFTTGV